jgi:hypothetical protein
MSLASRARAQVLIATKERSSQEQPEYEYQNSYYNQATEEYSQGIRQDFTLF